MRADDRPAGGHRAVPAVREEDAAWALAHQLVHRVVLPGEEMAEAERIAARLRDLPAAAMQASKRTLNRAVELSYPEMLAFGIPLRYQVLQAGDARALTRAFLDKRG